MLRRPSTVDLSTPSRIPRHTAFLSTVGVFLYYCKEVEHSEGNLTGQLQGGSEAAFRQIFNTYYRPLTLFALKYVSDIEEAREIVQEFYIRLWSSRQTLDIRFSLKSYLYQGVRNACLNFIESKKVSEKRFSGYVPAVFSNDNALEKMVAAEQEERLMQAIDELPYKCRQIFMMSRLQHQSNQQIADKLNISLKTVEAQITIALKRLRDTLIGLLGAIFWIWGMLN
jgi:RNA polymerase sigma-70 factor, ECF subfamily